MKIFLTDEIEYLHTTSTVAVRKQQTDSATMSVSGESSTTPERNLDSILTRNIQCPVKFLPVIDEFVAGINTLGHYMSQKWELVKNEGGLSIRFLDYLAEDRNNSTSKTKWHLRSVPNGVFHEGGNSIALTDAQVAVWNVIPKEGTRFIKLEEDLLYEGVFSNNHLDRALPSRVIARNCILTFEDNLAKRIMPLWSADYDLKFDGRIPRNFKTKEVEIHFYANGSIHRVIAGGKIWATTTPKEKDEFYLPDKEGGVAITRKIGPIRYFKETGTKNIMVYPDSAGRVYLLNNLIEKFIADKKEFPEDVLSAIKIIDHAEARRILMHKVGIELFLKRATTLDIDMDSSIHRALVLDKEDEQKYLVCHDGSTKRQYVLAVPDSLDGEDITTCKAAAAALAFNSLSQNRFSVRNVVAASSTALDDHFIAES